MSLLNRVWNALFAPTTPKVETVHLHHVGRVWAREDDVHLELAA